ncbi:DUF2666 family protein [Candidatus Micrarchaeota archaeon]|nr:DUF2666 family protein [Candidatus Micrarchaeota archaeon]
MVKELHFEGKYKDFSFGIHYNLDGVNEEKICYGCAYISENIEEKAFEFGGVDVGKVRKYVEGIKEKSASEFLKNVKERELRKVLNGAVGDKKLFIAAESCFFYLLLKKYGLNGKILPSMLKELNGREVNAGERIVLLAKYETWIVIKKMKIEKGVEDWEAGGALSGINNTLVRKGFEFSGIEKEKMENKAVKLTKGKRKSYALIGELLEQVRGNELERAYFVDSLLGKLKVVPYANLEMLVKRYPELKLKRRGRKPKPKKV